ncbi:hypothetical protein MAC_03498 [Metarhizium acridum CQMa 102]|uniref:SRR1-like domain-containing protein n=1 Tax=Metarhizium acridum (strain CQMa 102) TaxID=655827 RepID=E9E0V0_METAQ|nr:uncharacterized protein MAC_03498 [Metarhizium acridum CQMa 102]EFY90504.1 hypothetical protein MAC_03498 [Metarhizium acridum CQMa 102]
MSDRDSVASVDERSNLEEEIPLTEEEAASRDAFVASVRELYDAGTPFFTKEMIQLAQDQVDQIAEGSISPEKVDRLGFDGKMHSQCFPPSFFTKIEDEILFPIVGYNSFESLTMLPPNRLGDNLFISVRISGLYRSINELPDISQDDARCAFDKCFDLWEQGEEWADLKERIRPHLSRLPVTIDKIIGFGLGVLTTETRCNVDNEWVKRCSEQHALMLTLAKMFREHTGNSVKCFAQDPAYSNTCKDILGKRGVDIVHGDTGFLLVDENSIVLSFSPNVPVRQVIADLTRPAMMVCNLISKPTRTEWRRCGGVSVSPYTTDPVSPRVMALKEGYIELPINTVVSLGESAVYIRDEKTSKPPQAQGTSS